MHIYACININTHLVLYWPKIRQYFIIYLQDESDLDEYPETVGHNKNISRQFSAERNETPPKGQLKFF